MISEKEELEAIITQHDRELVAAAYQRASTIDLQKSVARVRKEMPLISDERLQVAEANYRRYMALSALPDKTLGGRAISVPSYDVDLIWHAHLLHTREYAIDCKYVCGRFINHRPLDNISTKRYRSVDEQQVIRTEPRREAMMNIEAAHDLATFKSIFETDECVFDCENIVYENEPIFWGRSLERAIQMSGEKTLTYKVLTRAVKLILNDKSLDVENAVVCSKVQWLKPGQRPTPNPWWHVDSGGVPSKEINLRKKKYITFISSDVSVTEFASGDYQIDDQRLTQVEFDTCIEYGSRLQRSSHLVGQLTMSDSLTIHRAKAATKEGWRLWIRVCCLQTEDPKDHSVVYELIKK